MDKKSPVNEFSRALYEAVCDEGGEIVFLSVITEDSHLLHDIDVVVNRRAWQRLPVIIDRIEKQFDWRLVQMIQYDVGDSFYFLIGCLGPVEGDTTFVKFDVLNDDLGIGHYGVYSHLLLEEPEIVNGLPFPAPRKYLTYLVQKRITKGVIDPEQFGRLVDLRKQTADEFYFDLVSKKFPKPMLMRAYELLACNDFEGFSRLVANDSQKKRGVSTGWARGVRRAWHQVVRLLRRVADPVGCVVVLPSAPEGGQLIAITMKHLFDTAFRGRVLICEASPRSLRQLILITLGWLVLVVPKTINGREMRPLMLYLEMAKTAKKRLLTRCAP